MAILWISFGAVIGAVISYLIADRRNRSAVSELAAQAAAAQQQSAGLAAQLAKLETETSQLREQLSTAQRNESATAAQLQSTQQNLTEQRKQLAQAYEQLRSAFAQVSAEALAKNNEAFLQLAKERFATLNAEATGSLEQRKTEIEGLLKPLNEMLGQYQKRLGEIEHSRSESYGKLSAQLGVLSETQRTLNTQTNQLVNALRRPQTRGQWGEVTLRRLVELAGMSVRCDFTEQTSVDTEEGRQRPDMVVNMPGDRTVVIDCKASLDAFLDAAAAVDDDARKICLQRHCMQVKQRARELSMKSYWSQFKRSPEFVVMFLPGEAFLYAALEHDGGLIEDTLKNRVIVATPTTLMALLRAIEFGWRQEEVTANAEEIRKHGRDLYERIAVVAAHLAKLGNSLDSVVANYNQVVGSMESRVISTARKIAELGAKTDKPLPEQETIENRPRQLSESWSATLD